MMGLLILPIIALMMYGVFNIDEAYTNDFDE